MSIGKTKTYYEREEISIFDRNRAICDVIRHVNEMDRKLVNQLIKNYVIDAKKTLD